MKAAPLLDLEAERAIIGCVLLDQTGTLMGDLDLRPEDFHDRAHQDAWRILMETWDAGEPTDPVIVGERVRAGGRSSDFLGECAECVSSTAYASVFAGRVREKAMGRKIVSIAASATDMAMAGKDPDEIAERLVDDSLALIAPEDKRAIGISDTAESVFKDLESGKRKIQGVPTGYFALDQRTKGMSRGHLWIVAGRPGMGKSSFAFNIAMNVARGGGRVAVFSLEVGQREAVENLVTIGTGIPLERVQTGGGVTDGERSRVHECATVLLNDHIFISDDGGVTPAKIRGKLRGLCAKKPLDLVIVDYIGLMTPGPKVKGGSRERDVADITRSLKMLAREMDVPIMALSQLNRGVEGRDDRRPRLADLRESGAIEQDADVVCLLYRPSYYHLPGPENGAEVIVAKQRRGETGVVNLEFCGDTLTFRVPTMQYVGTP